MLNKVLISVDLPSPDSPARCQQYPARALRLIRTNNHDIEIESLSDTLPMPLIGEIGKSNISCQFSSDHIPHVISSCSCSLGVFRGHCLCSICSHGVAFLHVGRCRFAIRDTGRRRRPDAVLRDSSCGFIGVSHVRWRVRIRCS